MKELLIKGWRPFVLLLFILIGWELAVTISDVPAWLLPSPSDIFQEGFADWEQFAPHLISTTKLSLLGLFIGAGIGFLSAVFLHLIPTLASAFYPLIILSQNVPIIVLAPLLIIWFGFGLLPKIIVITLVCFFPVTIAALDGFKQTAPELKSYMVMAGASHFQMFYMLELPHALPSIFSGLKISATYSVMGAVISEWLGAKQGIGVYMTLASSSFQTTRVFVSIFTVMVLSLLFIAIIDLIERKFIRWDLKGDERSK